MRLIRWLDVKMREVSQSDTLRISVAASELPPSEFSHSDSSLDSRTNERWPQGRNARERGGELIAKRLSRPSLSQFEPLK